MAQTILPRGYHRQRLVFALGFKELLDDLINVVRVATVARFFPCLFELFYHDVVRDLFLRFGLHIDEKVAQCAFVRLLMSQLGEACKVDSKFNLL